MWFWFALGSAVFAALTSILAKIGIEGVNSNLATAIRTMVVVAMAWGYGIPDEHARRPQIHQPEELDLSDPFRPCHTRVTVYRWVRSAESESSINNQIGCETIMESGNRHGCITNAGAAKK